MILVGFFLEGVGTAGQGEGKGKGQGVEKYYKIMVEESVLKASR